MKPDRVTTFWNEIAAARDARNWAPGASSVEGLRQPRDLEVLPRAPVARSATNGAVPVDLDDVNNARSLAVLSIPPHSKVLDVGSGPGAVARALAARGCRVWAIDIDSAATRLAEPWCDGILLGDAETADLDALLGPERVDAILFLDVLEHFGDPVAAIRRALPFLAPGGKMILSVPNALHAAVRWQVLAGAFPRALEGPPDPAPLHFCDRSSLHQLLGHAGVRVIDEARVVRSVEETEMADADTCQFVVTMAPGAAGTAVERMPTLVGTLTERLHRVERNCRRLEERARELEREVDGHRGEHDRLREALEEAREGQRRSAEEVSAVSEDLRRSELERQRSAEQLARTTDELVRGQLERRFLRDDVLVKDAYLASLRQQATLSEQSGADIRALTERLDDLTIEHAAAVNRAADLALSNREIGEQLERAQEELRRVHASVADTLAQPRYVFADRCNARAKQFRFLHAALKRVWAAW